MNYDHDHGDKDEDGGARVYADVDDNEEGGDDDDDDHNEDHVDINNDKHLFNHRNSTKKIAGTKLRQRATLRATFHPGELFCLVSSVNI